MSRDARGFCLLPSACCPSTLVPRSSLLGPAFCRCGIGCLTSSTGQNRSAGGTPLLTAAQHGQADTVALLLSKGAADGPASGGPSASTGSAALAAATERGHADVVGVLLAHQKRRKLGALCPPPPGASFPPPPPVGHSPNGRIYSPNPGPTQGYGLLPPPPDMPSPADWEAVGRGGTSPLGGRQQPAAAAAVAAGQEVTWASGYGLQSWLGGGVRPMAPVMAETDLGPRAGMWPWRRPKTFGGPDAQSSAGSEGDATEML